ncbi:MAG: hypothetical protein WKF58_08850 [Ilumatobacteraceae bacterium]
MATQEEHFRRGRAYLGLAGLDLIRWAVGSVVLFVGGAIGFGLIAAAVSAIFGA